MGGEITKTPEKVTKSVPQKIELVNQPEPNQQQPEQPHQPSPNQITISTPTSNLPENQLSPQKAIPEPVVETVVSEFVLLEQGCFTSHLLSFDNNKVLKIINWIC